MTDWIKTTNRLPDMHQLVLCWSPQMRNGYCLGYWFKRAFTDEPDGASWSLDGTSGGDTQTPTYWQPLPPRPHTVVRYDLKTVEAALVLPEPPDTPTRIWSGEHQAWWRRVGDAKGGNGYTIDARDAGIWTLKEAYAACCHCGSEKQIVLEALVPVT